jgi:hypothetical protein
MILVLNSWSPSSGLDVISFAKLAALLPLLGGLAISTGCRSETEIHSKPIQSSDSAFCIYFERTTFVLPGALDPGIRFIPSDSIVFLFGHNWPQGSEASFNTFTFVIGPGRDRFAFGPADFPAIRLYREEGSTLGLPAERKKRKGERIEGERTSDSTWNLRDWISSDYREWRRRESYRSLHPDLSRGFSRVCVRRPAPGIPR